MPKVRTGHPRASAHGGSGRAIKHVEGPAGVSYEWRDQAGDPTCGGISQGTQDAESSATGPKMRRDRPGDTTCGGISGSRRTTKPCDLKNPEQRTRHSRVGDAVTPVSLQLAFHRRCASTGSQAIRAGCATRPSDTYAPFTCMLAPHTCHCSPNTRATTRLTHMLLRASHTCHCLPLTRVTARTTHVPLLASQTCHYAHHTRANTRIAHVLLLASHTCHSSHHTRVTARLTHVSLITAHICQCLPPSPLHSLSVPPPPPSLSTPPSLSPTVSFRVVFVPST